jgi:hypothetical protein
MDSLFQAGSFLWQAAYRQVLVNAAFNAIWGVIFLIVAFKAFGIARGFWGRTADEGEERDLLYIALFFAIMGTLASLYLGVSRLQSAIQGFVATDYQTIRELLGVVKGVIK